MMPTVRRSFMRKLLSVSAVTGLVPLAVNAQPKISGRFIHMVFFWLKDPDKSSSVKGFMQKTASFLEKVEVVKSYHLGTPAGTPREVVDNSYTVCLVVTFDSKEDQDIYQKHQAHVDYVEEAKSLWTKVQVYDSWGSA